PLPPHDLQGLAAASGGQDAVPLVFQDSRAATEEQVFVVHHEDREGRLSLSGRGHRCLVKGLGRLGWVQDTSKDRQRFSRRATNESRNLRKTPPQSRPAGVVVGKKTPPGCWALGA